MHDTVVLPTTMDAGLQAGVAHATVLPLALVASTVGVKLPGRGLLNEKDPVVLSCVGALVVLATACGRAGGRSSAAFS